MGRNDINREQLKKLLLLALSSTEDGEIVAAIRALKNRVKKGGKDIHWLADHLDGHILPPLPNVIVVEWEQQLVTCAYEIWRLRPREQEFIDSLYRQKGEHGSYWQPSDKQKQWLHSIYRRVRIVTEAGF